MTTPGAGTTGPHGAAGVRLGPLGGSLGPLGGPQAAEGIRAVLDRTYAAILPGLTRNDNALLLNPAGDPGSGPSPVARLMEYSDITTVVSSARRGSLLGVIERAWLSFGYVIDEVNGDFSMPSMDVRTPDGYGVQLNVGAPGNVYFLVSSPLIRRPADTFAYSQPLVPTQLPDVDHPFWSH
ncbi:hypothetical protein POF50_019215 [Streptomyces sp. SL13]|uniref:Uncharacterized protein n=1 Tax=Streptantibioticus silvisoli TaxID=2705255 RepID=A0AA90H188_9ACTN|nr:hypothetical protein [Streptantibioticus silvisoli]MDI5967351.1 hypothetical protein [Streptantibioticus silvisoli]MDI5971439.1 hypothetical protein [Streptantibioticus silvisoli]